MVSDVWKAARRIRGRRMSYIEFAQEFYKESCDPEYEHVRIVYGPPGAGKTTIQKTTGCGIDTDDVRTMFGLHVGVDDELIYLLTIFMSWADKSFGPGDGSGLVYTNLINEVLKYSNSSNLDLCHLEIPSDKCVAERLAKRDGMDIEEALTLVRQWNYDEIRSMVNGSWVFSEFKPPVCRVFGGYKDLLLTVKRRYFGDLYLGVAEDESWVLDSDLLNGAVDKAIIEFVKGREEIFIRNEPVMYAVVKHLVDFVFEHSSVVKILSESSDVLANAAERVVSRRVLLLLLRDFYYEVYHNSVLCGYFYGSMENEVYQKAKVNLPLHALSFVEFYEYDEYGRSAPMYYLLRLKSGDVLSEPDQLDTLERAYFGVVLRMRQEFKNHVWYDLTSVIRTIKQYLAYIEPEKFFAERDVLSIKSAMEDMFGLSGAEKSVYYGGSDSAYDIGPDWKFLWRAIKRYHSMLHQNFHFQNDPKAGFFTFLAFWSIMDLKEAVVGPRWWTYYGHRNVR